MSDFFRAVFQRFGAIYVQLVDHDGEHVIRRVIWRGGQPCAWRFLWAAQVRLLDGGMTQGVSFVRRWQPYDPSAPKFLPTPSQTERNEG